MTRLYFSIFCLAAVLKTVPPARRAVAAVRREIPVVRQDLVTAGRVFVGCMLCQGHDTSDERSECLIQWVEKIE